MLDLFNPALQPFFVFFLRVMNNSVGTVRVVAMSRGHRVWGFLLASVESLMFAYTAGIVLTDLNNVPNLAAYVLGFSIGGYVGMAVENRFLKLFNIVDIITSRDEAREIASTLREMGYGVTTMHGEGARGDVEQLRVVVHHREMREVIKVAREIHPKAFIIVEESRMIEGGWMRNYQHHER